VTQLNINNNHNYQINSLMFCFRCPLIYESLLPIVPGERHCEKCDKSVYAVSSQEDLEYHVYDSLLVLFVLFVLFAQHVADTFLITLINLCYHVAQNHCVSFSYIRNDFDDKTVRCLVVGKYCFSCFFLCVV